MVSKIYSSSVVGVTASLITIEVNIINGRHFFVVGLPDSAVKESQHRVESSIKHCAYKMPRKKVVVNLAPADIRKEGALYDLPIAMGVLQASGQIYSEKFKDYLIMGELSLDGQLRPIKGVLPMAIQARKNGYKGIILPKINVKEAAIVDQLDVIGVDNLQQAIDFFEGVLEIKPESCHTRELFFEHQNQFSVDFADVQGQQNVKRALEITAAGGHNVIMIGPPGAGKTMLAKRLATILPPLSLHEALETTKIHSVAGKLDSKSSLIAQRPFQSPHHTISDVALVGGGSIPQPGEISLAHNGVLFLDELPEFKRTVLEVLRQPLEERSINISRAKLSIDYPANFMLIASMNPCPCGYHNHPEKECVCPNGGVDRYLNKISGPLLDRIDLHVEVTPVPFEEMTANQKNEGSADIRKRVIQARQIQKERFAESEEIHSNAMMTPNYVKKVCKLDQTSKNLIKTAMERLGLSGRAYDRILKVARTIADLDNQENILTHHIAEALQYRNLDRDSWSK